MDVLKNKQFESFDYICRYTDIPFYFNTKDGRQVYGLGSNMKKDTAWFGHNVTEKDTLDSLALKYYNNPSYWWVIAYFNDIQDSLIPLKEHFTVIKIPSISSIEFGDER